MDNSEEIYVVSCIKTDDNQYNICFSNGFNYKFSDTEIMEHYLYEENVPLKVPFDTLITTVLKNRAIKAIIPFVALSLKTEKQVKDKLSSLGFDDNISEKTIASLRELGYLNDCEYARKYINTILKTKISSRKMAEYELIRRGIPESIAEEAVFAINDYEMALKLINKKKKAKVEVLKLKKFLYSKGFGLDVINRLLGDGDEN